MAARLSAAILLLLLGSAAAQAQAPVAESTLDDVIVEPRRDAILVKLKTSRPPRHQLQWQDGPPRILVDLADTRFAWRQGRLAGPEPIVEVRGSQLRPGVARVVIELSRTVAYGVQAAPDGLEVALGLAREPGDTAARPAAPAPRPPGDGRPRLFGVVHGTRGWVAYIEDPASRRVGAYRVGDALGGAVIERIEAETVVLSGPQGPQRLQLGDGRPGLPARAP